jgi:chaperone modulatory protein CbpM
MSTENNLPQFAICILEEQTQLTLDDLCHACSVRAEQIIELVDLGVLEPLGREPWQFGGASLQRARIALRLHCDLDIDLAGAALALELLDEIDTLRARLRALGAEY